MNEPIRSPLLTDKEHTLLDQLVEVSDPTIVQLRDAVLRLSKLKVSEGVFPKYAAAIDEVDCTAFACLLVERTPIGRERTTVCGGPEEKEGMYLLLRERLKCDVSDMFLLVRPCIRMDKSVSRETRDRLADLGRLCVTVQNLPLRSKEDRRMFREAPHGYSDAAHHLWQGPLVDFLADEEGYGVHRQPGTLDVPRDPVAGIFGFGNLDIYMQASRANLGVFLPSGPVVSVDLNYPLLPGEEFTLNAGFVMARYTAKEIERVPGESAPNR